MAAVTSTGLLVSTPELMIETIRRQTVEAWLEAVKKMINSSQGKGRMVVNIMPYTRHHASIVRDDTSGYLRSACSSKYSIHLFKKPLPFFTVSESPITVSDRFGRVIATINVTDQLLGSP